MKIIRYDQQHIAIHFNPAGMWIMGLAFAAFAVIGVLFLGGQSILTCTRPDAVCSLDKRTLLKTTSLSIPLDQLHRANLEIITDGVDETTYKVVLETSNGIIPLTSYSSSGYTSQNRVTDKINTFLTDASQPSLEVKQDSRILIYIISAVFGGFGLLIVLLTSQITVDFDRNRGLATIKKRSLITSGVDEILLGDLAGAEVESSRSQDGTTYRVALVQRSGQRTPLTDYDSSGYKGKQNLADEINRFLKGV